LLVDCTVGLGGHAEALLEAAGPDARLIGIDMDESNLLAARERLRRFGQRVRLFSANFSELRAVLDEAGAPAADAVLADLGVCSTHLDQADRGFSFLQDGPLDMRLDARAPRRAEDLVNLLQEEELADLIYRYGEERYSRRIARAIVAARRRQRISRTLELADIVASAIPAPARHSRRGAHPATRTFQALRIAVNDELASLETMLGALARALNPGARAAVISFHSLEDRPVKRAFADLASEGKARLLTRKPVTAGEQEMDENPRSRSAKLRAIEWLGL
jgi:16S rRNA (cytosine1402-N4)-methyltransferase